MFASVLGMALSIEFGIARTYAIGVGFYVLCAVMIAMSRQANLVGGFAAGPDLGKIDAATASTASSARLSQLESAAASKTA
jgi:hypothetical protein